ncbi:MAG: hypothetical protein J5786_02680 [Clostridiales bacterium]|nr:hypothetical protein [Clostridiales bacterium]
MENKTFKPDYSRIKRRVILGLVLEIIVFIVVSVLFLVLTIIALKADINLKDSILFNICEIIIGVFFGHILYSIISVLEWFGSQIRSIAIDDDGLTVNGHKYNSSSDPDKMGGIFLSFTSGVSPVFPIPEDIFMVILSSGSQIRKKYWTGSKKNKNAIKLRQDIRAFVKPYFDKVRNESYEKVKEILPSRPIKISFNKSKYGRISILATFLLVVLTIVSLYGAFFLSGHMVVFLFFLLIAGLSVFYCIRFHLNLKKNNKILVNEIELSGSALRVDDDVYGIYDTKIDIFIVSKKPADLETNIRYEPPAKKRSIGIYIVLSSNEKSKCFFLGNWIDSEISAAIELLKCVQRMQEESGC